MGRGETVDEQAWLNSVDPNPMLAYLPGRTSGRKLRIFACVCARRVMRLIADPLRRQAIETAELVAEGGAPWESLEGARERANTALSQSATEAVRAAADAARSTAIYAVRNALQQVVAAVVRVARAEVSNPAEAEEELRRELAGLVRCVFGNPFRPAPFNPSWVTNDVIAVAAATYEYRTLPGGTLERDRMDVLSDCLEEAGATGPLLEHLRDVGPHVRGCFVVDLLTNRH